MSKIIQLSEDIINKIAAGEVIERPASVVKELVENSIDSGATSITVDVARAGKEKIIITDNGSGMSFEDAKLALLRHATSKIRTADDLFNIRTLGFRGEALASIAAVSHFVLTTKERDTLSGYRIVCSGGTVQSGQEIGTADGTTIEIHDLFFNTPVRKKFLKSDASEVSHIVDILSQYALVHPRINFKCVSNGEIVLQTDGLGDLLSVIAEIYGRKIVDELVRIDVHSDYFSLSGYVSKPTYSRGDKSQQHFFVNGRSVKNAVLDHAMHEAYHSTLFIHRYPFAVLMLDVQPQTVDVNIHPTKKEVKFDQSDVIYRFVYHTVRDVLQKNNLIPVHGFQGSVNATLGGGLSSTSVLSSSSPSAFMKSFDTTTQAILDATSSHSPLSASFNSAYLSSPASFEARLTGEKVPPLKLLGQIHKTFFLAEVEDGMLIIDQHIVQERVFYERFMNQYLATSVKTQTLLEPVVFDCSPAEFALVKKHVAAFEKFGFILEEFGRSNFLIRSVPSLFGKVQAVDVVRDLVGQFEDGNRNSVESVAEAVLTRMACRASVKSGDSFSNPEMQQWLNELEKCSLAYHCPHGRPIFIKITSNELEKMFLRV